MDLPSAANAKAPPLACRKRIVPSLLLFPALIPGQQNARIIYITFQLAEVAVPR